MSQSIHPLAAVLFQRTTANAGYLIPALNGTLIDKNDCTPHICSLDYAEMRYLPSFAGNLAYLIIFAVFLIAQLGLGIHFRTWGFVIGTVCGCLLEIVGYVGRLLLHNDDFNFNYFVMQGQPLPGSVRRLTTSSSYLVCLTIAPAFISASIYICLSRLVTACGTSIARFSPKAYTLTFISCDLISLILQATGGGIASTSNTNSGKQAGINIMIAGLAFQVFSLFLYMILGLDFIWAVRRASRHAMEPRFGSLRQGIMFRLFPYALAIATVTIFIRCCYRVAELYGGFGSSIANNQVLFMIFEGPMIMIAMLCLTAFHPGFAIGGRQGWRELTWSWKGGKKTATGEKFQSEESSAQYEMQRSNV